MALRTPGRWLVLAVALGASACRTAGERVEPALEQVERAAVEGLLVDLSEPGRATVRFVVVMPGTPQVAAVASQVEWQLWLDGRPFASGLLTPETPLPAGKPTPLEVSQRLRYGFRGNQAGAQLVDAQLEGTVTRLSPGADERVGFAAKVRLEVRSGPAL